jgi:hypothetical protein
MMKYIGLGRLLILLSGCISTKVKDFTDPEYQTFTAKKMLIGTPNVEFDEYFVNEAKDYNLDVALVPIHKLFLPTRQYTVEQKKEAIKKNKLDSYLAINVTGDSGAQSQVVGYQSQASASAYASGNYAHASGSSTTTPIVSHNRSPQSKATLYDPDTQNTI